MLGKLLRVLLLLLHHVLDISLGLLDIFLCRAGVSATVEATSILLMLNIGIFRRDKMLGKTLAQISGDTALSLLLVRVRMRGRR